MTKVQILLAGRTNNQVITDWIVLDELCTVDGVTQERAIARGWIMDEIEKRWPVEFDQWIENSAIDDHIEHYVTV